MRIAECNQSIIRNQRDYRITTGNSIVNARNRSEHIICRWAQLSLYLHFMGKHIEQHF